MSTSYQGTIIEESLADSSVLDEVRVVSTKVSPVTESHGTPWLAQWTLHTVEIPEEKVEQVASTLSNSFDPRDTWYADFNNGERFYAVFPGKVFCWSKDHKEEYRQALEHGRSLGIPEHQLDFPK